MDNHDRAVVLRGKASILTYDRIMAAIREAVKLDDGECQNTSSGYAWNPDCYRTPQDRINEAGASLGRILFAEGGCDPAAFRVFAPALTEQLRLLKEALRDAA